jgi:hypothetical protein
MGAQLLHDEVAEVLAGRGLVEPPHFNPAAVVRAPAAPWTLTPDEFRCDVGDCRSSLQAGIEDAKR